MKYSVVNVPYVVNQSSRTSNGYSSGQPMNVPNSEFVVGNSICIPAVSSLAFSGISAVPSPLPSVFYPSINDFCIFTATLMNIPNPFKGARVLYTEIVPPLESCEKSTSTCTFRCCNPACNFVCETADEMRDHFKEHPGKRSFRCMCPGCTFTSAFLKDLTYHRGIHTGERPYPCTFPGCSFAAPTQTQLRLHQISHSDKKPYKCSFPGCDYASRYKSALLNHERTHTGEKPYRCEICKQFSAKQSSGLQYHMKTVHGQN